jgi:hypothetical protein
MPKIYVIEMTPDLSGLHTLPEGMKGPIGVFYSIVIQAVVKWGDDKKGMNWEEQVLFRQIRFKMEEGMNTNDPKLSLTAEEYKFLTAVWREAKLPATANEALYRVGCLILTAKPEEAKAKENEK